MAGAVVCVQPAVGSALYLRTQVLLIQSEEHRKNTRWAKTKGREPTGDELVEHWYESRAHVRFREDWERGCAFDLMRQVGLLNEGRAA